ncbi:hypothetical protein HYG86_09305 [Alkalicella caledoniensis]|uniref:Uncharacterized protein n=1 Tax=Alkalicella caledoniensis TaxID=2731377 RepID=A0A7G9W8E6_ALKCA|nr:hypothetical protein [Alkalicella caledoniensis]QNO14958.1 hypothetical protein HYG86_09305 [Alkalicella caledoniensis]
MDLKQIQSILSEFDELRNLTIQEIIKEIKKEALTYHDVHKNLNEADKQCVFNWEGSNKFSNLFSEISVLIEKEKRDLSLKNNSDKEVV